MDKEISQLLCLFFFFFSVLDKGNQLGMMAFMWILNTHCIFTLFVLICDPWTSVCHFLCVDFHDGALRVWFSLSSPHATLCFSMQLFLRAARLFVKLLHKERERERVGYWLASFRFKLSLEKLNLMSQRSDKLTTFAITLCQARMMKKKADTHHSSCTFIQTCYKCETDGGILT